MTENNEYVVPTMIEGIGDEIIYASTFLIGLILIISTILYSNRNNWYGQGIHPDSAPAVEQTREDVRASHSLENQRPPRNRDHNRDTSCPICLGTIHHCVETNCGHCFCGGCIVTYWQHSSIIRAFRCPICRQLVTIMFLNFTIEEVSVQSETRQEIVTKIHDYNRKFSGEPRPILDYLRDLPTLLRHVISELFSTGGLVWIFRARVAVLVLAAMLYFISPLDIIPEGMFGILGFVDDIIIIVVICVYISIIYRQVVAERE